MDELGFRHLVARHELDCRHAPQRFARTTAAIAAIGQLAIMGLLALAAGVLWWAIKQWLDGHLHWWTLALAASSVSMLWSIGRSLWLRQPPPQGRALQREEVPQLFALVDKLHRRCKSPFPDQILLTSDLNAAVIQQPRLGLLGWHRNILVLGLPLLMALDGKQLAAVIAHELGHLRGGHGKMGAWVYRTRRSWWMLAQSRQQSPVGFWLADLALNLFFQHFFPRFNARAFVLARRQEVEADQLAHHAVGRKHAAQGLMSLGIHARFLSEVFWPQIWRQAARQAQPTVAPLSDMRVLLKEALRHPQADLWLREAVKTLPDPADTHPSLRDRLQLADVRPVLPAPPKASAADVLLGQHLRALIDEADTQWRQDNAAAWEQAHKSLKRRERRITELVQADAKQPLNAEERLYWSGLVWNLHGPADALPLLRQTLERQPGSTEAAYWLGRALLQEAEPLRPQGEQAQAPAGLAEATQLLNRVALGELAGGSSPEWALPAARWLEHIHQRREAFDALKPVRERIRELEREHDRVHALLHDFDGPMQLAAASISPRILRAALDVLRAQPAAGRAFLLRKTHPDAPGWCLHLLVVERSKVLGQPSNLDWWSQLLEAINLPFAFMVIDLAHPYWTDPAKADWVARFRDTPGACIYAGRSL